MIHSYKELIVWNKSIELCSEIYKITDLFPKREIFGLCSQMRRSSISISSNIAEGRTRGTRKDFAQFLRIALGSSAELETQLIVSKKLSLISDLDYNRVTSLLEEILKILNVMIKKLKAIS